MELAETWFKNSKGKGARMGYADKPGNPWSIVLAGGDRVRTKGFIRRWLGHEKPKQYCVFLGSRSMFQHTLDRAARLTPWERVVVVAAQHHHDERHHGHTHLTSTLEIGTIVSIWLPITQEFQLVSGNPMSADTLVTDNELVIREAIEKRLTRQGHHAVGYESGRSTADRVAA